MLGKSFCKVGLNQLLCIDWLLAWNGMSSEAGLSSLTRLWSRHLGPGAICSLSEAISGCTASTTPADHLVYSDGLSPLTFV